MPAEIKQIVFKHLDTVWFHSFIPSRFPATECDWLPLRLKECKHSPNHHHSFQTQGCIQGRTKDISYNAVGLCLAINVFPLLKFLDLIICYYQQTTARVCLGFLWRFPLSEMQLFWLREAAGLTHSKMHVSKKDCKEWQKDIHAAGAEVWQSYEPGLWTSSMD